MKGLAWLDIGGGEPFLRDDLIEICGMFKRAEITIPTNGSDPTHIEEMFREIRKKNKNELTAAVSMDGFEPINDVLRGSGSFTRALETIERLKRIDGITLKVNTVISSGNFSSLIPFMKYVNGLQVQYHSLLLLRGEPQNKNIALPPLAELKGNMEEILSILNNYKYNKSRWRTLLGKNYIRLLWVLSLKALEEQKQPIPCLAGRAHIVVYSNGDVAPCELLPPVANIFNSSINDIVQSEAMATAIDRIRQGRCYCTHNCNMLENILFNIRTYPYLFFGGRLG